MHFQLSLIVLCSLVSVAFAAMGQGALNFTRDYIVAYNAKVYNTERFCRSLRSACVSIAGPLNQHHQLDCVFSQKGPRIHAFCGGIAKDSTGRWVKGQAVFDHTAAAIKNLNNAIIDEQPMGKKACLKFRKKHSTVVC